MAKRSILCLCVLLLAAMAPVAQQSRSGQKQRSAKTTKPTGKSGQSAGAPQSAAVSSFQDFRRGLLDDYNSFRDDVLANYAEFLEGVWLDYESFRAEERVSEPKPSAPPTVTVLPDTVTQPEPQPAPEQTSDPDGKPAKKASNLPTVNPGVKAASAAKPVHVNLPEPELSRALSGKPEKLIDSKPIDSPAPKPTVSAADRPDAAPMPAPRGKVTAAMPAAPTRNVSAADRPDAAPMPAPRGKVTAAMPAAPTRNVSAADRPDAAPMPAPRGKVTAAMPGMSIPSVPLLSSRPGHQSMDAPQPSLPSFTFDFQGIQLQLPDVEVELYSRLANNADFAAQWRKLAGDEGAAQLVQAVSDLAGKLNFNDYLTYQLAAEYAVARYPDVDQTSRVSLVHFIMANLGYDARIALSNTGLALILLPTKQTLYSRIYWVFNNAKYYAFADPTETLGKGPLSVSTCQLPKEASSGKKFDLRIGELKIPYEPKQFSVAYGGLEIHGETNANLYPLLHKYPQMDIGEYAESVIMPSLRDDIVAQLKTQLADRPKHQAVDDLLHFVQSGFEYATDGEFHGFEKPYFFEEMLFYPKCDCEDRAVFYTYLLWNVLGVENHILGYPGHESASVVMSDVTEGDAYKFEGTTYYISDPTYIGSNTGMCMPNFRTVSPKIDHQYR